MKRFLLWLAFAEMGLVYAPTIAWLLERWTMSVWQHAHGLFVPPVVAYMVWRELRARPDLSIGSSAWGFAFVVPALGLRALDAGMHTELLSAASLVLLLPGLSLLVQGIPRTRAIALPLALLVFSLPVPLAFTEPIHWELRQVATAAAAALVPALGVPIFVEGTTIHLAGGSLEVADACSGFSTLYAAAAIACLLACTAPSRGTALLVIVAAAPLAVAANVLRVVALVLLVQAHGTGILDTVVHPLSGLATFALALPPLFWLGGERGAGSPR